MTLEERYTAVMKKFTAAELLALPEEIKEALQKTTQLEPKVKMLEAIADILNR